MSQLHVEAVYTMTRPRLSVGEMLSKAKQEEKEKNDWMLITIMQFLQFLGRQGLALQGHDEHESNFIQLLKLRSHDQKAC